MDAAAKQAVGSRYVIDSMKLARDKTWEVVDQLRAAVRPGMFESEAIAHCEKLLIELGMDRIWHPVLVRFGENTLKKFNQRSDGDSRLEDDDIFFIDLGVVWDAHEGDVGATFVVGDDAQMKACAAAVKTVFDDVERHWRETGAGGKALYDYAAQRADALGWRLNLDIKGHRVSDFPHAITRRAISAISTRIRTPAYGYSKYNWRIRRDDSARSMKTCSYKHY